MPPGSGEATITVTGIVGNVAASARVINFTEPVHGLAGAALTEDTEIVSADGTRKEFGDLRPGMVVQVSGSPGGSGMVLASKVRIVSASTPGLRSDRTL